MKTQLNLASVFDKGKSVESNPAKTTQGEFFALNKNKRSFKDKRYSYQNTNTDFKDTWMTDFKTS